MRCPFLAGIHNSPFSASGNNDDDEHDSSNGNNEFNTITLCRRKLIGKVPCKPDHLARRIHAVASEGSGKRTFSSSVGGPASKPICDICTVVN